MAATLQDIAMRKPKPGFTPAAQTQNLTMTTDGFAGGARGPVNMEKEMAFSQGTDRYTRDGGMGGPMNSIQGGPVNTIQGGFSNATTDGPMGNALSGADVMAMRSGPKFFGQRERPVSSIQGGPTGQLNPPAVPPVSVPQQSDTATAYKEAAGIIGAPKNTAQLDRPTLDTTLNPQPINNGQLVNASRGGLRGAQSLAEQYGNIDYDRGAIEGLFQGATDSKYAAERKAFQRTAGKYSDNLAQSQNSYLDAMRKANAGAIQNGANAGMQNANALSAVLGMSQQTNADATQLAQDERALEDQYASEKAQNTLNAMKYANEQKFALGNLDVNQMGVDAQQYAAELGSNAQVQAANTAASAQAYASDRSLQGTRYNADANLSGQKYASDSTFNSNAYNSQMNLYGNMYGANQNLAGSKYSSDQNYKGTKYAADKNYAATKYSADKGYAAARRGGGGSGSSGVGAAAAMQQSANNTALRVAMINRGDQRVIDSEFNNMYSKTGGSPAPAKSPSASTQRRGGATR